MYTARVLLTPPSILATTRRTPVDIDRMVHTGLDFWNDPRRWDDIDDPKRVKFWMKVYWPGAERTRRKIAAAVERERGR